MIVEVAPTAVLVAVSCVLAWRERGSVAGRDWLGWATLATLLLATVLAFGAARRPTRATLVAAGALCALAVWAALSLTWSPLPSLARDEALLTAFYAVALVLPAVTLRRRASRLAALAVVAAGLGATAVATAAHLRFGDAPLEAYAGSGRLFFPIGYVNAQAAFALVAFWPAVALAARRSSGVALRTLAFAAASALLAVAVLTQSRGAAIALALSALVVVVVLPARLRLALATLVPAAAVGLRFGVLTDPYEAQFESEARLTETIVAAGGAALVATGLGALAGLAFVLADRRLELSERTRTAAGRAAALLALAALATGAVALVTNVEEPREQLAERWEQFKQEPTEYSTETHFLAPGSNRYDFWRVALLELRDAPLAGGGSRGFGPAYLLRGESDETPARAHSLPLEVLAENGVVGFLLLATGFGAAVVGLARRRARVPAAAALAAATYWLLHASVDWIWTFPAATLPLFALVGIGLARDRPLVPGRVGALAGAVVALVAVLAFVPPWLAGRATELAAEQGLPAGAGELRRARTLDPLSVEALLVESQLAATPEAAIPPLREAVEREPRAVRNHFLLGLALLDAGRRDEARAALRRADELYPGYAIIEDALARAGG